MTKDTYTNAKNKKIIRDYLFSLFKVEQIIGLGGPDINEYYDFLCKKGIKNLTVYEYDLYIAISQMLNIQREGNILLKYGDVLSANPNEEGTMYDLDFCGTINTFKEHVKKFNDRFIMTFSIRKIGVRNTVKKFFELKGEKVERIRTVMEPVKQIIYTTNKNNQYIFVKYRDTSTMCCFVKI